MVNSTINAIWYWNVGSDPNTVASRCIAGKIDIIIPYLGAWNTNGTIDYNNGATQSEWKAWISALKSKSPNFRILGCVGGSGNASINLGSSAVRSAMVNSMVSCINTLNLDGFNEDTESFSGTKQDLISLWNAMDDALRPLGKISSADVPVWSAYPANSIAPYVHLSYLMPMCYNGGGWTGSDLQNCISSILNNSVSPVIAGLGQYEGASLSSQLSSIDAKISSWNTIKFRGFCIFEYSSMTSSDWTTWNNWPTKNPSATNHVLTSITVSPASAKINVSGTTQLTAVCKDQSNNVMTCPTLTWTSNNISKVTVSSTGKVTGIAAGTANITTKSGAITSNVSTVTVTSLPVLKSIMITPVATSTGVSGTVQLTATCKDQNNGIITCPALTWASSNISKVTVNSTGKVTGIATGVASITAKSGTITSNVSTVTVSTGPSGGITVTNPTPGLIYGIGEARVVRWTHTAATGANVKIELLKANVVVYTISSSTPNDDAFAWTIPSVISGNDYQVRITSTTNVQYTGKSSNFIIQGSTPIPVLTSIVINPATASINVSAHVQLSATCKDSNGTTTTCPALTWISSNTSKATVDSTGKVTGIAAGTTNITTKSGTIMSNASVITVIQPVVNKFSVYDVTPGSVINNVGVMAVIDDTGTFTKDQACVEVCRRLGLI